MFYAIWVKFTLDLAAAHCHAVVHVKIEVVGVSVQRVFVSLGVIRTFARIRCLCMLSV